MQVGYLYNQDDSQGLSYCDSLFPFFPYVTHVQHISVEGCYGS